MTRVLKARKERSTEPRRRSEWNRKGTGNEEKRMTRLSSKIGKNQRSEGWSGLVGNRGWVRFRDELLGKKREL